MKLARKALALALALILTMSLAAFPVAQADTSVKSSHGAFAAEALDRIFMILPTENGSSLYSMPELGGTVTLIESAPQINDLIAAPDGKVYYLRYTGLVFEVMPGTTGGKYNGGDYVYLNPQSTVDYINEKINPFTTDIALSELNIIHLED